MAQSREGTAILDQINTVAERWQDQETKKANAKTQVKETKRRSAGSRSSVSTVTKKG